MRLNGLGLGIPFLFLTRGNVQQVGIIVVIDAYHLLYLSFSTIAKSLSGPSGFLELLNKGFVPSWMIG